MTAHVSERPFVAAEHMFKPHNLLQISNSASKFVQIQVYIFMRYNHELILFIQFIPYTLIHKICLWFFCHLQALFVGMIFLDTEDAHYRHFPNSDTIPTVWLMLSPWKFEGTLRKTCLNVVLWHLFQFYSAHLISSMSAHCQKLYYIFRFLLVLDSICSNFA